MNTFVASIKIALFACIFLHLGQITIMAKDIDYQSVKSGIEIYVGADDLMDERLLEARERIRGLPSSAAPHLVRLFTENADDGYREAIVDAFEHNHSSYSISAPFILEQLQGPPGKWKGKFWIARAMDFLWKADPDAAASIARKAAESDDIFVRSKALKLLNMEAEKSSQPESEVAPSSFPAPSTGTLAPKKPTEQKPAPSTLVEESPVSPRWPVVAAVVVAVLGLLWLWLKKRK